MSIDVNKKDDSDRPDLDTLGHGFMTQEQLDMWNAMQTSHASEKGGEDPVSEAQNREGQSNAQLD